MTDAEKEKAELVQELKALKEWLTILSQEDPEVRFRALVEKGSDGIAVVGADGVFVYASPAMGRLLGCSAEEMVGRQCMEFVHPDDLAQWAAMWANCLASPRAELTSLQRVRHTDGSWRSIEFIAVNRLQEPCVRGIVLNCRDVTALRAAEEKQRITAQMQAVVADLGLLALRGTPLDIFLARTVHQVAQALDVEYCKVLELLPTGDSLLLREGVGWKEGYVGHALVHAGLESQAGFTLLQSEPVIVNDCRAETRFTIPSLLREHGVVAGMSVVIAQKEKPFGVLGAHTTGPRVFTREDASFLQAVANVLGTVVEENRLQEQIRESEAKYRELLRSAADAIVAVDQDGEIIIVNDFTVELFGYQRPELLGQAIEILVPERYRSLHVAHRKEYLRSPEIRPMRNRGELFCRRKDGSEFPADISLSPMGTAAGWIVTAIVRDTTERKRTEAALRLSQKMEAVGQLAAGVAHEINTPIQFIADNMTFLRNSFTKLKAVLDDHEKIIQTGPDPANLSEVLTSAQQLSAQVDLSYLRDEIPRAIEESLEGVQRVATIVRAMREFSHLGSDETTPVDINRAIENTITVARNEWKAVAEIETDLDASLPPVPCLSGEINQVILNLIINAAHAIADVVSKGSKAKGRIHVSTKRLADCAEIRVRDTGCGIPESIRDRVFDPFFTTKGVGKGTGQGLAIAHNVVVKKHGGSLVFESEVGVGTTFIIQLPLTQGPHQAE